ncbi:MAG: YfhO family protein [Lachnospiraceae bacterium]|nr:YfhO family protein [Lachnospiraceae bacterium]
MKKHYPYIFVPVITCVLYGVILAIKGIYPFGSATIDYYDMAQQLAAFYYHIYDALHGSKNLFFDWYTGLGVNIIASGISLSPFNLFFLLIRRELLLQSLSVFMGLKMICMSLAMYFYLDKRFTGSPAMIRCAVAVGYAFGGFVLMHYTLNTWLDIAAMFPVLMYFYDRLLQERKLRGYVVMLTMILVSSYYLGFMILLFLFLYTGVQIVAKRLFEKDSTEAIPVIQLGLGTASGIGLSAFVLIPQFAQMFASARFQSGSDTESGLLQTYLSLLGNVKGEYTTRWWTMLGLSFACAMIFLGIIRCRRNRKAVFMSVSVILLVVAELFFENINLLMHFGSYVHYPIRNGFIIYFVFAQYLCYFAGELFGDMQTGKKDLRQVLLMLPVALIGFAAFVLWYNRHPDLPLRTVFLLTCGMMAGMFVLYLLLLGLSGSGAIRRIAVNGCLILLSFEVLCYAYLMIGKPAFQLDYAQGPEQSAAYIARCDQISKAFDLQPERIERIKNPDESLNANYGFVLRQPALSSWTTMLSRDVRIGAKNLGYSFQYTRLLDAGGTVFSDALLGIRRVISCVPMDARFYEPVSQTQVKDAGGDQTEYTLYETKYSLPFGVVADVKAMDAAEQAEDIVSLHNALYRALLPAKTTQDGKIQDTEELAAWIVREDKAADPDLCTSCTMMEDAGSRELVAELTVTDPKVLYLLGAGGDKDDENTVITLLAADGTESVIQVPTIGNPDNTGYPAYFNNNALYLGTFQNESVKIRIKTDPGSGPAYPISIFALDLAAMDQLGSECRGPADGDVTAGKTTVSCRVQNDSDDAILLLPVVSDAGFKATVNGEEVTVQPLCGLFTGIPLYKGGNEVLLKFVPKGLYTGCVLTALTFLLLLLAYVCGKILRKRENAAGFPGRKLPVAASFVYSVLFLAAILFLYVIPVVYGIGMLLAN